MFLCINMYYLPNLYFAETYNRNENSSKDQKSKKFNGQGEVATENRGRDQKSYYTE